MRKAFTMFELVLVIAILVIVSTALLGSFVSSMSLDENSRMTTIAVNIARDKIEDAINKRVSRWTEITSISYCMDCMGRADCSHSLQSDYGFNGSCSVDVLDVNSSLKFIRVVVCWKMQNGRIVGTDNGQGGGVALDGIENGSEQTVSWPLGVPNPIDVLNSPVVLVTAISQI